MLNECHALNDYIEDRTVTKVSDYRTEETLIRILISIDLLSNTISDRIVAEVI